jgi:hypothetical protein
MLNFSNTTNSWILTCECYVLLYYTSHIHANFWLCLYHIMRYRCFGSCEVKHGILNLLYTYILNPPYFYLVCEAIGTEATPGLLCQPRV